MSRSYDEEDAQQGTNLDSLNFENQCTKKMKTGQVMKRVVKNLSVQNIIDRKA